MDHDHNFKNLILDYPRQALEFFAPAEAQRLETARIVPIRQEQVQERLGERFRELDTPLLVEWPDGEREALLFVVEEESEPRRFSIHRLAHYCLDLAELFETDRVAPVAIFLRPGEHRTEIALRGDAGEYLRFRYIACDLGRIPVADYLESPNIVARLNLPNLAHTVDQRLDVYAAAVVGLLELEQNPERRRKYIDFIEGYARLNRADRLAARRRLEEFFHHRDGGVKQMAGLFTWEREDGVREGETRGFLRGESNLIRRQLTRRFGALPPWVTQRLDEAPTEKIEEWGDRLLDAKTLDEVFH